MNWHKNLVFGEEAAKKKSKIINDIDNHKIIFGVYVIILSVNQKDIFDILPSYMLFKDNYKNREIVGVSVTKNEAYEVCARIINEVFEKTGTYKVREYYQ